MTKNVNNANKSNKINLITLGDGQVGKTSLIFRYIDNVYSSNYLSTIGIDYKFKNEKLSNGEIVNVKLSDTAGQERFRSIAKNFLMKADGIILVYDITNRLSFNNLENWFNDINEKASEKPIILIGNKLDLERKVDTEEGIQLAKKFDKEIKFFETSCKTGENVEEAIKYLVEQVYNKNKGKSPSKENIKIKKGKKTKDGNKDKKKFC